MRIIISPAKKMRVDTDSMAWRDLPAFLEEAQKLQALLLQLGAAQTDGDMAQEELSEQVRAVHAVHAYLTQNLETRVTIEELSKQYLMRFWHPGISPK